MQYLQCTSSENTAVLLQAIDIWKFPPDDNKSIPVPDIR